MATLHQAYSTDPAAAGVSGARAWLAAGRRGALGLTLPALLLCSTPAVAAEDETASRLEYERNTMAVAEAAGPSVVAIRVSAEEELHEELEEDQEVLGGSGFVVDDEGRIITNFHVVSPVIGDADEDQIDIAEGAALSVSFLGSPEEAHEVRIVGANSDVDLALLELVDPNAAPSLDPIPLGDSEQVGVGQQAIAIGNPFGLHSTVTSGIVSALEREQPGLMGIEIPYIQTDAAINPGNSGGPLLNSAGEVIGINNAILAPTGTFAGIGLAVPSNLLKGTMDELLAGGLSGFAAAAAELPERPRLGLQIALRVADYPPPLRQRLDLPDEGVVVTHVAEEGPAARAGIEPPREVARINGRPFPVEMDVITAIDGESVTQPIDIQRVILDRDEGDVVTLKVWREGSEHEVDVELEVVPVEE